MAPGPLKGSKPRLESYRKDLHPTRAEKAPELSVLRRRRRIGLHFMSSDFYKSQVGQRPRGRETCP